MAIPKPAPPKNVGDEGGAVVISPCPGLLPLILYRLLPMTAFEVYLNGEKLCTAGLGDAGVLSAILSWRGAQPYKDGTKPDAPSIEFSVGGLTSPAGENVRWAEPSVRAGDEILIRIVDTEFVDTAQKV
jgi:hypothetical protein